MSSLEDAPPPPPPGWTTGRLAVLGFVLGVALVAIMVRLFGLPHPGGPDGVGDVAALRAAMDRLVAGQARPVAGDLVPDLLASGFLPADMIVQGHILSAWGGLVEVTGGPLQYTLEFHDAPVLVCARLVRGAGAARVGVDQGWWPAPATGAAAACHDGAMVRLVFDRPA